jgi:hypothetical protein
MFKEISKWQKFVTKKNTGLRWILQYFLEAGSKVFVFVSVINQERKVLGASNTQS